MRFPRRGALTLALLAALLLLPPARADELVPPPEAADGADYEVERADSIEAGEVEVGLGAAGSARGSARQTKRMRVSGDGLRASVREGKGDPLASSRLELATPGGRVAAGRLVATWGRGLVMGAPIEPWRFERAAVGFDPFTPRGDGVSGAWGGATRLETFAGRFARAKLAGARFIAGPAALGLASDRAGARRASVGVELEREALEAAWDGARAWRIEAALDRALAGGLARLWARTGAGTLAPLAEPRRAGPARALGLAFRRAYPGASAAAGVALWRERAGVSGSRAALELDIRFPHHGAVAFGCEEQRGVRRSLAATSAAPLRQGAWAEWRVRTNGASLVLREERWGERAIVRSGLRAVTAARFECDAPFGARLALTQAAYRVRRGESLYLPEAEADRLVLRALTGTGERTRLEVALPAGSGRVRASLALAGVAGEARSKWTIDWTRRARLAGAARAP